MCEKKYLTNVLGDLYKDLLSPSAKVAGKTLEDITKTASCLFIPFFYIGSYKDRFEDYISRIHNNVKEENRINAPTQIVGESFEAMKYLDPNEVITEMFINLLSASIDKDKVDDIHPAFPHILSNICRDEAVIIYLLSKNTYSFSQISDLKSDGFYPREIENLTFPKNKLHDPDKLFLFLNHLANLDVAGSFESKPQEPIYRNGTQIGTKATYEIRLKEFGALLAKVCTEINIKI